MEKINLGRCLISECCSHYYPIKIIDGYEKVKENKVYTILENIQNGAFEDYEGLIVEIQLKIVGTKDDLYKDE
jgi:hypothetical protein